MPTVHKNIFILVSLIQDLSYKQSSNIKKARGSTRLLPM